jgi:hypothetical protein
MLDPTTAFNRAYSDTLSAEYVTQAEWRSVRERVARELDGDDVMSELCAVRLSIAELSVAGDTAKLGAMVAAVVNNYVDRITDMQIFCGTTKPTAEAVALKVLMWQA